MGYIFWRMIAKHLLSAGPAKQNILEWTFYPLFSHFVFKSRCWVHGKLARRLPALLRSDGKKGLGPARMFLQFFWNITNLVKCHLEWESKHILIRLFKVEGPRLRLWERVGQLIALFDVMFGICLHFDVTAWKLALCSTALLHHTHLWMKCHIRVP